MMLRYSFDLADEADCIENAVNKVLEAGWRTKDIAAPGAEKWLTGSEMKEKILAEI